MYYIITAVVFTIIGAVAMYLYKAKVDKQIDRTKEEVRDAVK